jgi:hypothetical protein
MRRIAALVTALGLSACKDDPNAKLNAVRDELANPSPSFDGKLTPCPTDGSCLGPLAKDLGSTKGWSPDKPDQASVGALAVLVARDGHAEWANGDFLQVMEKGKGAGADALRLAVGLRLSKVLPTYAHALTDAELTGFFKDISRALPGSCKTYALLGDGKADATLAIEDMSDHSACVQKDLQLEGGPGGGYGQGPWRAAAALLTHARAAAKAVDVGSALMPAKYKQPASERAKAALDALGKVVLVTVGAPTGNWTGTAMQDAHGGDGGTLHGQYGGDAGHD